MKRLLIFTILCTFLPIPLRSAISKNSYEALEYEKNALTISADYYEKETALPMVTEKYGLTITYSVESVYGSIVAIEKKLYLKNLLAYDGNWNERRKEEVIVHACISNKAGTIEKIFKVYVHELEKDTIDNNEDLCFMERGEFVDIEGTNCYSYELENGYYSSIIKCDDKYILVENHKEQGIIREKVIVSGALFSSKGMIYISSGDIRECKIKSITLDYIEEDLKELSVKEVNDIDDDYSNQFRMVKIKGVVEEDNDKLIIRDRSFKDSVIAIINNNSISNSYINKNISINAFLYNKRDNSYDVIVNEDSIELINEELSDKEKIDYCLWKISKLNNQIIKDDINLDENINGVDITYKSNNEKIISSKGIINKKETIDEKITFTVKFSIGKLKETMNVDLFVEGMAK